MGEQENCCNVGTRASKKRVYDDANSTPSESIQERPLKNKRVVLGELTNSSNIAVLTQDTKTRKPKSKSKKTTKKEVNVKETEKPGIDGEIVRNELPKCGYAPLIYQHLHSLEVEETRRPLPDYMHKVQKDITQSMREILVDWLVEVAEEYRLVSDTLYLTVSYIDRFLSSNVLNRNKLQLLGVACMVVASKYEEISPPRVEDFCYITDNTYTGEEVVDMEKDVLKFLNFEMGSPTTKTFLRVFTRAAQETTNFSSLQFEFLGSYLAELSLPVYTCVRFLPSVVAAASIFLARFTIQPNVHPWSLALQQYTGYKPVELKECVLAIHDLQLSRKGASLRAIREKYKEHKFKCVADLRPPSEIPMQYFHCVYEKL